MQGCVSQVRREKGFQAPQAETQRKETERVRRTVAGLAGGARAGHEGTWSERPAETRRPKLTERARASPSSHREGLSLGVVWSHLVIHTNDSGSQRRMDLKGVRPESREIS